MAALTVLTFAFVPQLATLFGARGRTAVLQPYAAQYLYGLSFEIVPYVLFCVMTPVVILDNGGRLVSIASVCGCAADVVLDLLSVRFGWGLLGFGLASSASAAVYCLITLLHFVKRDRVIRLHFARIRFGEVRQVFVSSVPKGLLSLADALCSALFISLVSLTGGVVGTCVLTIHGTLSYTVLILAKGIAGAVGIMAGICWGEKNGEELEANGVLAHRYMLVLSVCAVTALAVFARPLASALTDSGASEELLRFALYCICFTVPFILLVNARISYLQATERIREAQRMGIAANLLFLAADACLLAIPFGVRGVFMAYPVSQLLTLCVSWLIHKKRTGKLFPAGCDYLEADDSFYNKPGDVISYPLETSRDSSPASEQVVLFCRGHKLEDRQGMLAGLCVEELAANAFEHGIKPGQIIKTADLRVVVDGGDVIVRLRCGGPAFNLKQFADRLEQEDRRQAGTGIRILLHAAKSVSYYRTYGMNTTIIKV